MLGWLGTNLAILWMYSTTGSRVTAQGFWFPLRKIFGKQCPATKTSLWLLWLQELPQLHGRCWLVCKHSTNPKQQWCLTQTRSSCLLGKRCFTTKRTTFTLKVNSLFPVCAAFVTVSQQSRGDFHSTTVCYLVTTEIGHNGITGQSLGLCKWGLAGHFRMNATTTRSRLGTTYFLKKI